MPPSLIEIRRTARSPWRRACLSALAACVLLANAPRAALAEEPASLEALIQEGIRLRRDGEDEKALEVFRQAERLQPSSVRVLLHLATAAQAAGHWVEADTYVRRVFDYRDDPYYRRYEADISTVERLIASRVGRFQVVGSPPGAEVRLNGRVVGQLPMAEAFRLEAGNYQLEVVSQGHYALRRSQRIPGGVLTREVVDLGPETSAAESAMVLGEDQGPPRWWEERWVAWSLAGVGAASALTAGIAFVVREQQAAEWNDDGRCVVPGGGTREQQCGGDYGDARMAERIGATAAVGALLFGGAAIAHFTLIGPPGARQTRGAEATLETRCGAGWLGVSCKGTF